MSSISEEGDGGKVEENRVHSRKFTDAQKEGKKKRIKRTNEKKGFRHNCYLPPTKGEGGKREKEEKRKRGRVPE